MNFSQLKFPQHVAKTTLRPDIILVSETTKYIVILEPQTELEGKALTCGGRVLTLHSASQATGGWGPSITAHRQQRKPPGGSESRHWIHGRGLIAHKLRLMVERFVGELNDPRKHH